MASLQLARVMVEWSGTMVKGAAANVLYFEAPTGVVDLAAIRSAYSNLQTLLPAGCTLQFPGAGDLVDEFTGVLQGAWTATSPTGIVGAGAAGSAAGAGACVSWNTGMVVAGHRLRGRTFIVPLATDAYDATGTLASLALTMGNAFATAMNAIPSFVVWHRPTHTGTGPSRVNNNDGAARLVASYTLKDKVAFLSSRRD
jgi:hypothetical protein